MDTKPFGIQAPEEIAKTYGGDKQKIARAAAMGIVDPTAAVLAGMFIDRMRSAAVAEQAPQNTVADQVLAAPQGQPQMQGQPQQAQVPPQPQMQPPMQAQPQPQPQQFANGGMLDLQVPENLYDYADGGLVSFADAGAVTGREDNLQMQKKMWMRKYVDILRGSGGIKAAEALRKSAAGMKGEIGAWASMSQDDALKQVESTLFPTEPKAEAPAPAPVVAPPPAAEAPVAAPTPAAAAATEAAPATPGLPEMSDPRMWPLLVNMLKGGASAPTDQASVPTPESAWVPAGGEDVSKFIAGEPSTGVAALPVTPVPAPTAEQLNAPTAAPQPEAGSQTETVWMQRYADTLNKGGIKAAEAMRKSAEGMKGPLGAWANMSQDDAVKYAMGVLTPAAPAAAAVTPVPDTSEYDMGVGDVGAPRKDFTPADMPDATLAAKGFMSQGATAQSTAAEESWLDKLRSLFSNPASAEPPTETPAPEAAAEGVAALPLPAPAPAPAPAPEATPPAEGVAALPLPAAAAPAAAAPAAAAPAAAAPAAAAPAPTAPTAAPVRDFKQIALLDKASKLVTEYNSLVKKGDAASLGRAKNIRTSAAGNKEFADIPGFMDWAGNKSGLEAREMAKKLPGTISGLLAKADPQGVPAAAQPGTPAAQPGTPAAAAPADAQPGLGYLSSFAAKLGVKPEELKTLMTQFTGSNAQLDALDEEYKKQMEGMGKQAEEDKWMSLLAFAGNLAGSKSPTLGGALGEAAKAALPQYTEAGNKRQAQRMAALKGRADISRTKAETERSAFKELMDIYNPGGKDANNLAINQYAQRHLDARKALGDTRPDAVILNEGMKEYVTNSRVAQMMQASTAERNLAATVTRDAAAIREEAKKLAKDQIGFGGSHRKEYRKILTEQGQAAADAYEEQLFNAAVAQLTPGAQPAAQPAAKPAAGSMTPAQIRDVLKAGGERAKGAYIAQYGQAAYDALMKGQ